jgi:TolB-like protein/class 3 adenylate cyclase/Flp pilus assembly protein TadD
MMNATRRLAAILAADVAGYSRLMGADEEGTHERLKAHLQELVDPKIKEHRGRVVKNTGDGFLAEFASVVDAVRCAVEVQRGMIDREPEMPDDQRTRFRIGINLGDVIAEEHDIFGDGVNVAARLEALTEPGGICVSRVVRDQIRDKLDLAFDDMGEQQVKNIARPVRVYRIRPEGPLPSPPPQAREGSARSARVGAVEPSVLVLPDKPSIAVLPFQNMSGDPEQDYFVDGMVEEIITALSRIRWLFVIARNSSFTYKGQAVDVRRVGRELGVRYVLEGSVRKGGNRVRITAQLIDALTDAHLWADRFDGLIAGVFELQDEVASSVAGVIEPALQAAEIRRSAERPTSDLTAYDLYLRALPLYESGEKNQTIEALELLGQAIGRDPRYSLALALAAQCHAHLHVSGWTDDPELHRRQAVDLARRALGGDDPNTLGRAAHALGYSGGDLDAATALVDRCLELNPSYASGWINSGWLRLWAGQPDLAIEHLETGLRLNPRDRQHGAVMGIGVGHFFARRLENAAAMLLRSLQERPNWVPTYRFLASCYAHMGRLDEARETIERVRQITLVVVPSAAHWRDPEQRAFYLEGLRLAAGEAV